MDDQRVGALLRALRRRRGMRQIDVAALARVGQATVSRAERGHLDGLTMRTIRALFAVLDARIELETRWRGGEIDRLVDERHSALVAAAASVLADHGWSPVTEVTFSVYGERGSIDLIGLHAQTASVALVEAKTEITSFEEMERRFDVKARLVPRIVEERFGWQPRQIARILVVADTKTNRRRLDVVRALIERAYPLRTIGVRRWLQRPSGVVAGVWFLSSIPPRTGSPKGGGSRRVRVPSLDRADGVPSVARLAAPPRQAAGPSPRRTNSPAVDG